MTRYFPLLKTRIVLRTMIFNAGVLAVLVLACTGAAAGATTWVVDGGGGMTRSIAMLVAAAVVVWIAAAARGHNRSITNGRGEGHETNRISR